MRRVREHALADAVDALHVGDGVHHADVARPDVGPRVAAGHRRHHDLGHAHRQGPHGRGGECGAARAAGRDQAAQVAPREHVALEGGGHRADGAAAVAAEHARFPLRVVARHLARRHAGGGRLAGGREVHRHHAQAELLQAQPQVVQLAALGVEGAGDVGGAARGRGHREVQHGGGARGRRYAGQGGACRGHRRRRGHRSATCRRRICPSRHRRRRQAGARGRPAVEAGGRARPERVQGRQGLAMGAAHGQHLDHRGAFRGRVARARRRRRCAVARLFIGGGTHA